MIISHCNRGKGQRSNYNLLYQIPLDAVDVAKLKKAIEVVAGLKVKKGDEEHYKDFYSEYDKTLKDLGCSFCWGKHLKAQKIGNCVIANLKGLLKERLPEDVYKWYSTAIRDQSNSQHLVVPVLQAGKELKDKQFNIDMDDDFFLLRQLINYILDKTVEGVVNFHAGKMKKFESLQTAFKALGDYEKLINENKALSEPQKIKIKAYIHSKIDLYKEVSSNIELYKPNVLYRILMREGKSVFELSSADESKKIFFKHLIGIAARNPNFFSDIYDYVTHEKIEKGRELFKLVLAQAIEIITGDSVLNDQENLVIYRTALRKIFLKECEHYPYDQSLIGELTGTEMLHLDASLTNAAYAAMNNHKNSEEYYATFNSLLVSILNNREFLGLFAKKEGPVQVPCFFKPQIEPLEPQNLSSFFKIVAKFVLEHTEQPVVQEILQLHLERLFEKSVEFSTNKNKAKRFLEFFCYKQLIDSNIINAETIKLWRNLPIIAHQCKQIRHCLSEVVVEADSFLLSYNKLKGAALNSVFDKNEKLLLRF